MIALFIVLTALFSEVVKSNEFFSSDAEYSFEEHMMHHVGAFSYIIDESDKTFLQNGTFNL